MRIPSGDLAPVRRPRRRRARPWLAAMLASVLVAGVAGGAVLLRRQDASTGAATRRARCAATARPARAARPARPASPPARSASPAVQPPDVPAPRAIRLRLLNGTGRDKLARAVGTELTARGFQVTATANAPRALDGPTRVYFWPAARPAALRVEAQVVGAVLVPAPATRSGVLDVVLGSSFSRLRTAGQAADFVRALPTVRPTPAADPPPGCG